MARVAELMGTWAQVRGESEGERARWLAAGFLHDTLRDEDYEILRAQVEPAYRSFPGHVLHGPAAARKLLEDGVEDDELVHAIRFHTLGSAEFGNLGLALYAADFLEPGRKLRRRWRAKRRGRAATNLKAVVKEILAARIGYLIERERPLHPQTADFWNKMAEGQPWVSATEY
jgi:2-amino-4-hydroxy-6-hydroxymethyldihydropteridine diphosphokinase